MSNTKSAKMYQFFSPLPSSFAPVFCILDISVNAAFQKVKRFALSFGFDYWKERGLKDLPVGYQVIVLDARFSKNPRNSFGKVIDVGNVIRDKLRKERNN